jgi:hypothetical protein
MDQRALIYVVFLLTVVNCVNKLQNCMRKWRYESYFEIYKKYLYCARKSRFGLKIKALKISKKKKKTRSPAHFLAKAKDAN